VTPKLLERRCERMTCRCPVQHGWDIVGTWPTGQPRSPMDSCGLLNTVVDLDRASGPAALGELGGTFTRQRPQVAILGCEELLYADLKAGLRAACSRPRPAATRRPPGNQPHPPHQASGDRRVGRRYLTPAVRPSGQAGHPQRRRSSAPTRPLTGLVEQRKLSRCANRASRHKGGSRCVLQDGRPSPAAEARLGTLSAVVACGLLLA
jgi:hypothetical protein